ncbi:MAG: hypothetical protein KAX77_01815 [Xanthomonadales bacterium]|nr:hypothetical protein [Xanthomonadales bacterium]
MSIPRPPSPPSPNSVLRSNRNRPPSAATLRQGADRARLGTHGRDNAAPSGGATQRGRARTTGISEPAEVHERGPGKGSDIPGY